MGEERERERGEIDREIKCKEIERERRSREKERSERREKGYDREGIEEMERD